MESVAEIWKDVKGFEGMYQVSNLGRVRSLDRMQHHPVSGLTRYRGRMLTPRRHTQGYLRVQLSGQDWFIHRLVASHFLGSPGEGETDINHRNGDKTDNRVENLEHCTRKHNMRHACDTGLLCNRGDMHTRAKATNEQVHAAYELVKAGVPRKVAAERVGIAVFTLDTATQGKRAGFEKIGRTFKRRRKEATA